MISISCVYSGEIKIPKTLPLERSGAIIHANGMRRGGGYYELCDKRSMLLLIPRDSRKLIRSLALMLQSQEVKMLLLAVSIE